jgi:hypothetical protein
MDISYAANSLRDTAALEFGPRAPSEPNFDQQRRARVGELVLGIWTAARRGRLADYLEPIPLTRLYAAQRACREIGAVRVANIFRSGLFNLTRVGAPVALSQVVVEMTILLTATTEDVDGLVSRFTDPRLRKASPSALSQNQDAHKY